MGFYDEMQGIATDLLTEFNQGTVQYEELIPGSGPPDNPGEPTLTPRTIAGATSKAASFKYVDGTHIKQTDVEVTFNVIPNLVVDDLDYLLLDGKRAKIIEVMPIPQTGVTVVYKVFVRR